MIPYLVTIFQRKLSSAVENSRKSAYAETIQLALSRKEMALSIHHLQGVFTFWLIGNSLAILILGYELMFRPVYAAYKTQTRKRELRKQLKQFSFQD